MSGDMRCWMFDGPRSMHVETRPIPEPGAGEVRLRVARVGLCGSDIHGYAGESGLRQAGVVMGHEASAVVDAVGQGVEGRAVGDRVAFAPTFPCEGECGHTVENRCDKMRLVGVHAELQGAFADYIVLPDRRLFDIGTLTFEQGASIEPLSVGLHSARRAGVAEGDRVLVVGGGMIGQAAALAARYEGAAEVVVSDPLPERQAIAARSGFTGVHPDAIADLGYVDCAIEAVGITATFKAAIAAVKRGGVVSLVGLGLPTVEMTVYDLVGHERVVAGSSCYSDAEFGEVIRATADGRLDLSQLAPIHISFDEIGPTLERFVTGEETAIKVMADLDR
jgi:threonine dehydrogenase-like Zn-dependent dehydrogenase